MRPAMWRFNILKFASCRSIFLWSSLQFNHLFSIFIEKIPTFLRVWFIYGMKIFNIYHKSMPVAQSNKLSNDCKRKLVINYHSLPQRRFTRSKNTSLSRPKLTDVRLHGRVHSCLIGLLHEQYPSVIDILRVCIVSLYIRTRHKIHDGGRKIWQGINLKLFYQKAVFPGIFFPGIKTVLQKTPKLLKSEKNT